MEYRKTPNLNLMCKLLAVLAKYQNAGKGDTFYHLSGHISEVSIQVYVGRWELRKEAEIDLCLSTDVGIQRAIEDIQELYDNTPNLEEIEAKMKEAEQKRKREQYEKLKAEFES